MNALYRDIKHKKNNQTSGFYIGEDLLNKIKYSN